MTESGMLSKKKKKWLFKKLAVTKHGSECIKPTDRVFSKCHEIIYISIAYSDDEESEDDSMF